MTTKMDELQQKAQMDQLYAEMQKAAEDLKQLYADERRNAQRITWGSAAMLITTIGLAALGESFQELLRVHGALALAFMTCVVISRASQIFVERVLLKKGKAS